MIANEKVENEVKEVLKKYWQAWEDLNFDKIMELYSDDSGFASIGTGAHEISLDLEKLKRGIIHDLKEIKDIRFETKWIKVSNVENVAWAATGFTATIRTEKGQIDLPSRLTAVFVKKGGKWLIVQTHFSNPNPNQRKDEAVPDASNSSV